MKQNTAHTPGPWHVGGANGRIVYAADGFAVADATVFHGRHGDAVQAASDNARLIAAAPALLAALYEMYAAYGNPDGKGVSEMARAAIASARGEG